jgi:hypothetical protein
MQALKNDNTGPLKGIYEEASINYGENSHPFKWVGVRTLDKSGTKNGRPKYGHSKKCIRCVIDN